MRIADPRLCEQCKQAAGLAGPLVLVRSRFDWIVDIGTEHNAAHTKTEQANTGEKPLVYLRQPDVFLKTVVHSASRGLESSLGSCSQPECGMMTSLVIVCRPWLMITIFRGS